MRLFCHFFLKSFCGRETSNGLTLTDLIISVWAACVAGVKRGGRGVGSKKEKKEGGKKGEGIPSSLSYTPSLHPLSASRRLVFGVYYDHEKFKMFNARIVSYRVHRFVFMSTLNPHWLDEKEKGKVITCNLLSIAVTEGFSTLRRHFNFSVGLGYDQTSNWYSKYNSRLNSTKLWFQQRLFFSGSNGNN